MSFQEQFQEKWVPVFHPELGQHKNLEPVNVSVKRRSTLKPALFALIAGVTAQPALALDTATQLTINLPASAQTTVTTYQCEGLVPFSVQYLNAEPLFLAFVPIKGEKTLFVHVLSADGAKYASGQYVWWTRGNDATLTDLTAAKDAKPLACQGINDIP